MKVLFVDDNKVFTADIAAAVSAENPSIELVVAPGKAEALALLSSDWFDVVVCDLMIPSSAGAGDANTAHGMAVKAFVQANHPGTPIIIFSAVATLDLVEPFIKEAHRERLFGGHETSPLLSFCQKKRADEFVRSLIVLKEQLDQANDVDVQVAPGVALERKETRVLRIFGSSLRGRALSVTSLTSGLSGVRTVRVQVLDAARTPVGLVVAKIGQISKIVDESERVRLHVQPRLPVGSYVPPVDTVRAGAADFGGLFYSFAAGYSESLGDLLRRSPALGSEVVARLMEIEKSWQSGAPYKSVRIGSLRSRYVADSEMPAICGDSWNLCRAFEGREVQIRECCQHGDLHLNNVLVDKSATPLLIDFGDVADAPASLDAITLELSPLFHPSLTTVVAGAPGPDRAPQWPDAEAFWAGSSAVEYAKRCREWAMAVAAGQREVLASAYVYAIRQLKYEDTNHDLAKQIALACARRFDEV